MPVRCFQTAKRSSRVGLLLERSRWLCRRLPELPRILWPPERLVDGGQIVPGGLDETRRRTGLLLQDLVAGSRLLFRFPIAALGKKRPAKLDLSYACIDVIRRKSLCEPLHHIPKHLLSGGEFPFLEVRAGQILHRNSNPVVGIPVG